MAGCGALHSAREAHKGSQHSSSTVRKDPVDRGSAGSPEASILVPYATEADGLPPLYRVSTLTAGEERAAARPESGLVGRSLVGGARDGTSELERERERESYYVEPDTGDIVRSWAL